MIERVQVESVSVPVSDQDQAKEFYVDTLGFELLVDNTCRLSAPLMKRFTNIALYRSAPLAREASRAPPGG